MTNFRKILALGSASLVLALSSACAAQNGGQPLASASAIEVAPEGAIAGPALWQVSDEDTTIYLFGTVHILPDDVNWFDARIESAFNSSDDLVFEVDTSDAASAAQGILAKAMLSDGQTLRGLMTEENRTEFEEALTGLGLPPAGFDPLEPWLAAMTLSVMPLQAAGYNTESGVEMSLTTRAGDKTLDALETIDEQIDLFDGMPMKMQLDYLDATIESLPEVASSIDALVAEWVEGDAAALGEMMNADMEDEELYNRLLINRNANWVGWIGNRLEQPGTVFIAVGAGHLAGKGSVQEQLETSGLTVTRIWK